MPGIQDYLNQLMGTYPEWVGGASKNAGYAPPDIGSQASQLNYLQDLSATGMDPLQLWLAGEMDGGSLASTFEDDQVTPARTEGVDALQKILQTSPMSVEGMIAAGLLEGKTSSQVIQEALDSGAIQVRQIDDPKNPGKKMDDPNDVAQLDRYRRFADDSWKQYLSDRPEQRIPGKEILHPFVQRMLDAGFTDPRQQYTSDYVDPSITDRTAKSDDLLGQYKNAVSAYQSAQNPQSVQTDLGGQRAQQRVHAQHHDPMAGGSSRGARGGLTRPGGATVAANPNTANLNYNAQKGAMDALLHRTVNSRVDAGKKNADVNSFVDAMQRAGRTPALDQFAAVLANLRNRGLG